MKFFYALVSSAALLISVSANAAYIDNMHPSNGGNVRDSFQFVGRVSDLPLGRSVDVSLSIRDKETGDELVVNQISIAEPRSKEMIIERVDLPQSQKGKLVTITLTARDTETGDELTSGTIEALVRNK